MNRYTIYCTQTQAAKALGLGAPIEYYLKGIFKVPTAEQMIVWLEEQMNVFIEISREYGKDKYSYYVYDKYGYDIENLGNKFKFNSRKEATLVSIDAALEHLIKTKEEIK